VARAKRTDRSEARRRARQVVAEAQTSDDASGSADVGSGGAATSKAGGSAKAGDPTARPGILDAFRGSLRPLDLRGDIRQIPWLITKTPAVWLPSLLVVAATVWYSVTPSGMSNFAFQIFVYPPPQMGAAFLAGMLASRMSYMAGFLVGLVCAASFTVFMLLDHGVTATLDPATRSSYILAAIGISPVGNLAIAAFAGFYRRFLRRAGPGATRRPQPSGKGAKAAARR
jgi:hypothetical protein